MSAIREETWQTLRSVYDDHNQRFDAVIVDRVAADALTRLDPDKSSKPEVVECALMQLKQMARQLCRHFRISLSEAERAAMQGDMFSDKLQDRYPVGRDGREMYVKRNLLTLDEREHLIKTLEKVSAGMDRHAKALRNETRELVAQGVLRKESKRQRIA